MKIRPKGNELQHDAVQLRKENEAQNSANAARKGSEAATSDSVDVSTSKILFDDGDNEKRTERVKELRKLYLAGDLDYDSNTVAEKVAEGIEEMGAIASALVENGE